MYAEDRLLFASGGRSNYRIPSIVVTSDGTAAAFCNDRKDSVIDHAEESALVFAKKTPGGEWSDVRTIAGIPGWACSIGSAVYDDLTDTLMCTASRSPVARNEFGKYTPEQLAAMEKEADRRADALGIRRGAVIFSSGDGGETWTERPFEVEGRTFVRPADGAEVILGGSCHGSAHGIRLRHGEHAGRLLCPARVAAAPYDTWEGLRTCSYNNAVYSDDRGLTWKASAPVQPGTGEGTLIERADGSVLYNSRAYFGDGLRLLAVSRDGGETYGAFSADAFLREETSLGCNASFLRVERDDLTPEAQSLLPGDADSLTLFVNPRSDRRDNLTVCVSFDSGASWAVSRTVWSAACAYSSLDYSAASGRFFLLYERGESSPYAHGIAVLEFDAEWILSSVTAEV